MIYFIQAGEGGRIKIGCSHNVARRLEGIRCSSPFPIRLILETDGDVDFERTLHRAVEQHRVHMEWFEPHQDVIDLIEEVRTGQISPPDFDPQPSRRERNFRHGLMENVLIRANRVGVSDLALFQAARLSATILHNWRKRACTPSLPTLGKLERALADLEAAKPDIGAAA